MTSKPKPNLNRIRGGNVAVSAQTPEWNKATIDYEYGQADLYTPSTDLKEIRREFINIASSCFGIRKSIGEIEIKSVVKSELPEEYAGKNGTHLLTHTGGDEILVDMNFTAKDDVWKIIDEWGEECSCIKRGKPQLSCEVHHFWVSNHDKKCDCQKPKSDQSGAHDALHNGSGGDNAPLPKENQ